VLFVVGEEKGSDGARAANTLPVKSRFLINGEPLSKLASGAKGSLRAIIRTRGRKPIRRIRSSESLRSSRCSSFCPRCESCRCPRIQCWERPRSTSARSKVERRPT
jgi:hypothetical protein